MRRSSSKKKIKSSICLESNTQPFIILKMKLFANYQKSKGLLTRLMLNYSKASSLMNKLIQIWQYRQNYLTLIPKNRKKRASLFTYLLKTSSSSNKTVHNLKILKALSKKNLYRIFSLQNRNPSIKSS